MRLSSALVAALLSLSAAAALPAQTAASAGAVSMPTDSLAHARHLTALFFSGKHDSLLVHFAPGDEPMTAAELQNRLEQLAGRAGSEVEVIEEKFVKRNGMTQYWRTGKYTDFEEPVLFRWAFTKQGQIAGMGLGPASNAPAIDPD